CFFFQADDSIRVRNVTGVQTCALPILNTVSSVAPRIFRLYVSAVSAWCSTAQPCSMEEPPSLDRLLLASSAPSAMPPGPLNISPSTYLGTKPPPPFISFGHAAYTESIGFAALCLMRTVAPL